MKQAAKLPKPSKVHRKLTLSKETLVHVSGGTEPPRHQKCTAFRTGCLPYTC